WVYAEIVRTLARHERVDLIVNDASWEKRARAVLEKAGALSSALADNIRFHRWRTDRVWTRDSGCIFLTPSADDADSGLLALHFQFNAWAKYPNYKLDEKVGARMAKAAGARAVLPFSENYAALHANLGRLKNARTSDGQKLEIVEIPLPRPVVFEGRQLPASYANFYIANGAVLVPVFN